MLEGCTDDGVELAVLLLLGPDIAIASVWVFNVTRESFAAPWMLRISMGWYCILTIHTLRTNPICVSCPCRSAKHTVVSFAKALGQAADTTARRAAEAAS
ncbi:hypothetical protein RW1_060_00370 [Rhodococcus wratislaviensis NBRC 100605]|uniref:Uncharacterized protein n=1 Tax=Rhodococcus wratislaviensis NBRC 100605 TaxID=1219028 RepID=X0QB43_RHOWR|nr:hypothetical protein RW1_060_00370 [Rhodococcus wratislaviensis NBRC 100605]